MIDSYISWRGAGRRATSGLSGATFVLSGSRAAGGVLAAPGAAGEAEAVPGVESFQSAMAKPP